MASMKGRTAQAMFSEVESETEDAPESNQPWIFCAGTLARLRQAAHSCAVEALRSAVAEGLLPPSGSAERQAPPRRAGSRAAAGKDQGTPDVEKTSRYALYYAQQLPQLCFLCGAPSEVRWTATVFFRRFFAFRSPLEFDPMHLMFAAVHLACKVEEVHEITLDRLLEAAGFKEDSSIRIKVASLELPLLETLNFTLLVEPKPEAAMRVLATDLQQLLQQQLGLGGGGPGGTAFSTSCEAGITEASPPLASRGAAAARAAMELLEDEASRDEVLSEAGDMVLRLSVRTDAILVIPPSVLVAAALGAALDAAGTRRRGGEEGPQRSAPSEALMSLLDANLNAEPQRAALRRLLDDTQELIGSREAAEDVPQAEIKGTVSAAKSSLRAFERLRDEATERHEAHRKERKRRYSQMKGNTIRRGIPTPVHRALFVQGGALFDGADGERPPATFVTMGSGGSLPFDAVNPTSRTAANVSIVATGASPNAAPGAVVPGVQAAAVADEAFGVAGCDAEDFVLHRPGDDMEEDD